VITEKYPIKATQAKKEGVEVETFTREREKGESEENQRER